MTRCRVLAWGCALVWGWSLVPVVRGQSPAEMRTDLLPFDTGVLAPPSVSTKPAAFPPSSLPEAADATATAGAWKTDLVLGLPAAIRVQRLLNPAEGRGPVLEGLAGLYAIFPVAGGGLRWRCMPLCGAHDALVLSPGVDGFVLVNSLAGWGGPPLGGLASMDVDCSWQHQHGKGFASEVGLKLGGGVGFASRAVPLPVAAVYGGFRY